MYKRILFSPLITALVYLLLAPNNFAQDLMSGSSVFIFKRPASAGAPANKPVYRKEKSLPLRKHTTSVPATSKPAAVKKTDERVEEQLGVTLWRLRPERSDDTGARLLTQSGSSS